MHLDIFRLSFWSNGAWQGFGVVVFIVLAAVSPFFSKWVVSFILKIWLFLR